MLNALEEVGRFVLAFKTECQCQLAINAFEMHLLLNVALMDAAGLRRVLASGIYLACLGGAIVPDRTLSAVGPSVKLCKSRKPYDTQQNLTFTTASVLQLFSLLGLRCLCVTTSSRMLA